MRYTTQLEEECPGLPLEIRAPGDSMLSAVSNVIGKAKIKRLGIEGNSATVSLQRALAKALPNIELVVTEALVEQLRIVKDKDEIEATRVACVQARRAFEVVRAGLTPEMTEFDVAAELEYQARRFGAKALSFPAIVAVGPRAALPHATPTRKRLVRATSRSIDWGVNSGLYMSDLTRMIVTGKISPKLRKVYGVVLKAQLAAIDAIRPGVTCEEVDRRRAEDHREGGLRQSSLVTVSDMARDWRSMKRPGWPSGQKTKLEPGMIVTVEPGIYLPGWGGVRIEDDVLVTRNGHEVLSDVPKQLDDCVLAS